MITYNIQKRVLYILDLINKKLIISNMNYVSVQFEEELKKREIRGILLSQFLAFVIFLHDYLNQGLESI